MPSWPDWNRKLHFYLGLYLLLFLWLFAFTGLLLNHPLWKFAEFWPNRTQTSFERTLQPPPAGSEVVQARDIMRQLGVRGEIEWTRTRPAPERLDFRVSRPGLIIDVNVDLQQNRASVQRIDLNAWGVTRALHSFTGVRPGDKVNARDWLLTTLWAISMDALALGVILMVLTSLWMWWRLRAKRRGGLIAAALGLLSCGFFVLGLRWMF